MKKMQRNERILFIASGVLLFSIILMIAIIPGILNDISPNAKPKKAALAVLAAIVIHLIIFILYIKFIRESRHSSINRKGEFLGIGGALIFFGLVYMDGAFASLSHQNMLFESILWFTSTLCDFVASIMLITLFFLKPQKVN